MRSEAEVVQAIDKHADMVLRLCSVYLKNRADAEDVFQTVFLKYALSDLDFAGDEHEKAWLIRVTANACKDLLKNFFRRNTVSLETVGEKSWELSEEHLTIHQAVHTLPKNYREVIYLHYYEGYTAVEIAGILKRNPNTVYTHLRKGKELLREALDNG